MSNYKTLSRSYSLFKSNMVSFILNILSFVGLDKIIYSKIFLFLRVTFKWLLRGFTIFNFVLVVWIFYFNTPVITAKLILGWLGDFFRVAKLTYTDTIARFLDYLSGAAENGLKSVPKHAVKPVEYPDGGFIKTYREIFQQIKDLPPRTELPSVRSRWYDFLRDPYDLNKPKVVPSNPFMPDNGPMPRDNVYYILNYLKDYWQIALIATGGVIILGGGLYFFWDPITSGTSYSWSAIKGSYESIIQYFTTKAPEHTGTGGADGGDNPLLGPVDESSQIELTDFTPRNREGAVPLNSSPRSLLSRADEFVQGHSRSDTQVVRDLIAKSPKVPSTPLDLNNQGGFFTQDTFSVSQDIGAESTGGRFTQSLAEGTNPETRPVITVTPSPDP